MEKQEPDTDFNRRSSLPSSELINQNVGAEKGRLWWQFVVNIWDGDGDEGKPTFVDLTRRPFLSPVQHPIHLDIRPDEFFAAIEINSSINVSQWATDRPFNNNNKSPSSLAAIDPK